MKLSDNLNGNYKAEEQQNHVQAPSPELATAVRASSSKWANKGFISCVRSLRNERYGNEKLHDVVERFLDHCGQLINLCSNRDYYDPHGRNTVDGYLLKKVVNLNPSNKDKPLHMLDLNDKSKYDPYPVRSLMELLNNVPMGEGSISVAGYDINGLLNETRRRPGGEDRGSLSKEECTVSRILHRAFSNTSQFVNNDWLRSLGAPVTTVCAKDPDQILKEVYFGQGFGSTVYAGVKERIISIVKSLLNDGSILLKFQAMFDQMFEEIRSKNYSIMNSQRLLAHQYLWFNVNYETPVALPEQDTLSPDGNVDEVVLPDFLNMNNSWLFMNNSVRIEYLNGVGSNTRWKHSTVSLNDHVPGSWEAAEENYKRLSSVIVYVQEHYVDAYYGVVNNENYVKVNEETMRSLTNIVRWEMNDRRVPEEVDLSNSVELRSTNTLQKDELSVTVLENNHSVHYYLSSESDMLKLYDKYRIQLRIPPGFLTKSIREVLNKVDLHITSELRGKSVLSAELKHKAIEAQREANSYELKRALELERFENEKELHRVKRDSEVAKASANNAAYQMKVVAGMAAAAVAAIGLFKVLGTIAVSVLALF